MMDPLKGAVPLVVEDGRERREYTLVLDHRALIAAEAAHGVPLALTMAQASLGFIGALGAMLFGALRTHHPAVTLDEAQKLTLENQDAVDAALSAATRAGFPDKAEGKDGARPPAKPRAGKRSGASGAKRDSTPKGSSARPRASSKSSSAGG